MNFCREEARLGFGSHLCWRLRSNTEILPLEWLGFVVNLTKCGITWGEGSGNAGVQVLIELR